MKQTKPIGTASKGRKGLDPKKLRTLLLLVLLTVVVYTVYRVLMNSPYFVIGLAVYMAITVVLIFGYLIYNRGMSRRGVTEDMLPTDWSEEEKQRFLADAQHRLERSRWVLVPMLAFLFTFAIDAIELFVIPFFAELISKK